MGCLQRRVDPEDVYPSVFGSWQYHTPVRPTGRCCIHRGFLFTLRTNRYHQQYVQALFIRVNLDQYCTAWAAMVSLVATGKADYFEHGTRRSPCCCLMRLCGVVFSIPGILLGRFSCAMALMVVSDSVLPACGSCCCPTLMLRISMI